MLEDEALVPIGSVAVGNPARIVAPCDLPREATARERMERQAEWFGAHRDDSVIESP